MSCNFDSHEIREGERALSGRTSTESNKSRTRRGSSSVRNVLKKFGDKKLSKEDHEVITRTNRLVSIKPMALLIPLSQERGILNGD
jgi:hypothetical protein